MSQLTPMQKMQKARNKLLLQNPFFGVLALKLNLIEDPTCNPPTAWVNGIDMGFHPDFIEALPDAQVKGLVAHEVMHCVFKHCVRRKERDPQKWNIAGDHVINIMLLDQGFDLPEDGIWDFKYRDMTTDHIYSLLPPELECKNGEAGKGKGFDECRDAPVGSKAEQDAIDREWTIAIKSAAQVAKNQGMLPGDLEEFVTGITDPKVPWREVLRNFMTRPNKNDYTMTRPNRRFISSDLYLPSMYSEGLGDVLIVIDTSGSISNEELKNFQSEVNCILEDTQPEKVYVLYCDTQVHKKYDEYEFFDLPIKLVRRGGGGTDFTAPFQWVIDHHIVPDVFIYFTDLYGSCSAIEPDYPVLWLCTTNKKEIPFGELIAMN